MEGGELEEDFRNLRNFPRLPLWIIEHVWAHRVMDIQQVVDSSHWPDVDSQPLSLEDSWRLRVCSAKAYSIMKNRDLQRFESVITFLEATHRLVPGLVKALKHMKVVFGLKTLIVMGMFRDRCSLIETSLKILHFFPTDLPQYRGQCSPREMFLMRTNHLDFRVLAQILTTDKDKRQYYVKHQLEQQYGDVYAQKVEERLLQYLQQLEQVLPRDTHVDQVRRKSPENDEERLLLRVIGSDAVTIATTLERLLRCDAASCRLVPASGPPADDAETSEHSRVHQVAQNPGVPATVRDFEKSNDEEKQDCSCNLKVSSSSSSSSSSSPQFCSRHRRWVRSILSECSDPVPNLSEPISPPLFQSSPSGSSSQDLTPSGLLPLRPQDLFLLDDSLQLSSSRPSPGLTGPAQLGSSLVSPESVLPPTVADPGSSSSSWRQDPIESEPSSHQGQTGSTLTPNPQQTQLDPSREDSAPHSSPAGAGQIPPLPETISLDQQVQLRMSAQTQQVLLCSKLLQPRVSICRLEVRACDGPASPGDETRSEDPDSSLDVNCLYTDSSSSFSDSKDSDYQPSSKRRRHR